MYMLTLVVFPQLLGTPTDADVGLVKNEDARRYIRQLPQYPRQPLNRVFPHVHPLAIDLVDKMLTIDPTRRITGNFLTLTFIYVSIAR
jgi:mitogen-activated protein kinase 1/3